MPAATKTAPKKPAAPAKKTTATTKKSAAATAAKPKAAAKPAAKSKAEKPAAPAHPRHPVTAEQRRYYVEVAAYYIAERHGFAPGRELENWTAAEVEIDRLLAEGALNP